MQYMKRRERAVRAEQLSVFEGLEAVDAAIRHEPSPDTMRQIVSLRMPDALQFAAIRVPRVFTIQAEHNPIGPFDFAGEYDDRSDRVQPLPELLNRGYEDAYRQFIEPVVGASGERVGL